MFYHDLRENNKYKAWKLSIDVGLSLYWMPKANSWHYIKLTSTQNPPFYLCTSWRWYCSGPLENCVPTGAWTNNMVDFGSRLNLNTIHHSWPTRMHIFIESTAREVLDLGIFIDCEAREIMHLVVSVCPFVCVCSHGWTVWAMTLFFALGVDLKID